MSAKGKERATDADGDGSDNSDIDFFTFKPKKAVPKYSPPPTVAADHGSEDDDDEDGIKKKKAKKKKDKMEMADWTKAPAASPKRGKKRGSTESSRARSSSSHADLIVLDGSPDKGKGKRKKVELTPPPEMTKEQRGKINQLVENFFAMPDPVDAEPVVDDPYSSDRDDRGDVVTIRVHMKSDPAKKATASVKAVQQWEKLRTFKFNRRDPFRILVEDLAKRLSKTPEELALIYDKQRIMSTNLTPQSFGITSEADMEGYEKLVWESLEKSRLGIWDDDPVEVTNGDPTSASIGENGADVDAEATPTDAPPNAIVVHIRCEWGEEKLGLQPSHTVKKLLRHYAKKHGKESEVGRLVLEFDGDQYAPTQTIAEVGLESGDLVDLLIK